MGGYTFTGKLDLAGLKTGDMPGDKICIDDSHILRAEKIFPVLHSYLKKSTESKVLVSVFGGSGVGKSEIGSILSHFCQNEGCPSYLLSGDNYPHRSSAMNDAERLNVYRSAGWAGMAKHEAFRNEWNAVVQNLIAADKDADPLSAQDHPGIAAYQHAGRAALYDYLGTPREIDFAALNWIIEQFRADAAMIPLKRIGENPAETLFEAVDFSGIRVLIIEWTHGHSTFLNDVDFSVFLCSTQEETAEHRRLRGRDPNTDSAFVRLVLEIEQEKVNRQTSGAQVIVMKDGQLLSPDMFHEYGHRNP